MQKYNCKNCGAELYWDASAGALKCAYCDEEYQPSDFTDNTKINDTASMSSEADAAGDALQQAGRMQEPVAAGEMDRATDDSAETADLVLYQCSHCGAEVVTASSTIATTCAYCGRAISLSNKLVGDFRPESAIPFSVTQEAAMDAYKKYCKKALLTPKQFLAESEIQKIKGVYVPYWLHSCGFAAQGTVNGETQTSRRSGNDKVITHHVYATDMRAQGSFVHIPTDGLKRLDDTLMDALAPFDYEKIQSFNPAFMAGYYAEEYDEDKDTAFARTTHQMDEVVKDQMKENAGTYANKSVVSFVSNYRDRVSRYVMLPVWLLNVTYNGKDYLFAVNGNTGKAVGKLPISQGKLWLFGGGAFLGTQIIAFLMRLIGLL